ncbi:MAG TPA: hypothetical protein VMK82_01705 [Steroidobacteraceae bacterium]|nr:hypothetical protein [Steroidobacteraceae bacterium]
MLSAALTLGFALATVCAVAGEDAAVSTINHAFATELGTGVYDMGGRSIFVIRFAPERQLRAAGERSPGIRLVLPLAAGSFDFNPFDTLQADVPDRVDSFSVMPGIEFDIAQESAWVFTPWLRAGGSFSEGQADGLLYGLGARLTWAGELDGVELTRLHGIALMNIDYHGTPADDRFLRLRNAVDLRRTTLRVTPSRLLLAGFYAIADIVPDPPDLPLAGREQSVMQLELGVTFNLEPRPRIGSWRWPRLGFGYRMAGDFSGWRIAIGAPF